MKRNSFDKAFKSKVAIAAIKGDKTIQELATQYSIHPSQITLWKKQLLEGAEELFVRPNKKKKEGAKNEEREDLLLKSVGRLQIENEFLKKKYREQYGHEPNL